MKVDQPIINLGKVVLGKERKFNYRITNDSDVEARVSKLTVGCSSCTRAHLNVPIISPGQTVSIEVIFTPNSTGINMKGVDIHYAEAGVSMPIFKLKFKAEVVNG